MSYSGTPYTWPGEVPKKIGGMSFEDMFQKTKRAGACQDFINKVQNNMYSDFSAPLDYPQWFQWYARHVLKGRFPEGEAVIAASAYWAYEYARLVLKDRFPESEAVIAASALWAYYYALDVLKGRFPESEAVIAASAEWAYWYARDVI